VTATAAGTARKPSSFGVAATAAAATTAGASAPAAARAATTGDNVSGGRAEAARSRADLRRGINLSASDAGEELAGTGAAECVARNGRGMRERVSEAGLRLAEGQEVVAGSAKRVDTTRREQERDELGVVDLLVAVEKGLEDVGVLLEPRERLIPGTRLVLSSAAAGEGRRVARILGGKRDREAVAPLDARRDEKSVEDVVGPVWELDAVKAVVVAVARVTVAAVVAAFWAGGTPARRADRRAGTSGGGTIDRLLVRAEPAVHVLVAKGLEAHVVSGQVARECGDDPGVGVAAEIAMVAPGLVDLGGGSVGGGGDAGGLAGRRLLLIGPVAGRRVAAGRGRQRRRRSPGRRGGERGCGGSGGGGSGVSFRVDGDIVGGGASAHGEASYVKTVGGKPRKVCFELLFYNQREAKDVGERGGKERKKERATFLTSIAAATRRPCRPARPPAVSPRVVGALRRAHAWPRARTPPRRLSPRRRGATRAIVAPCGAPSRLRPRGGRSVGEGWMFES